MNEDTDIATPPFTCIQCAEPIAKAAKKCRHCGGFQNYRRYFEFSNTALALVIALFSVVTVFLDKVPDFLTALKPKGFSLGVSARINEATMDKVVVVFLNTSDQVVWVTTGALCHTVSMDDPDQLLTGDGRIIRSALRSETTGNYAISYTGSSQTGGFFLQPNETSEQVYDSKFIIKNENFSKSNSIAKVRLGCFISIFSMNEEEGHVVPIVSDTWQHALIEGVSSIDTDKFKPETAGLWLKKK